MLVLHKSMPSIGVSRSSGIASLSTFSLDSGNHCLLSGMLYSRVFCVSFSLTETQGRGNGVYHCYCVLPSHQDPTCFPPCMCQTQLASYIHVVVDAIACIGGRWRCGQPQSWDREWCQIFCSLQQNRRAIGYLLRIIASFFLT